jgi:hypothetical protein
VAAVSYPHLMRNETRSGGADLRRKRRQVGAFVPRDLIERVEGYRVNQESGSRLPTGACTDLSSAVYRRGARWLVLRQQSQLGGLQPPTSTPLATASDDHATRLWETNVNNVAAGICNHPRYHQKRVGPIHAQPDLPTPMRVSHLPRRLRTVRLAPVCRLRWVS